MWVDWRGVAGGRSIVHRAVTTQQPLGAECCGRGRGKSGAPGGTPTSTGGIREDFLEQKKPVLKEDWELPRKRGRRGEGDGIPGRGNSMGGACRKEITSGTSNCKWFRVMGAQG